MDSGSSDRGAADDSQLPNRSPRVLVTTAVFLGIATVFVTMRCISKFGIRKRADVDDCVIIVAWAFTVALCISIIIGAAHGLGRTDSIIMLHPEWWSTLKKSVYVFPIFYHLSSMTAKTAALLLYIRMASAHTFLRYASYVVLAIVDISGVILILLNIFQCRPLAAAWTWNKEGQCTDIVTLFLASSPINILSDLAILYLPLPIITGLRIERTAKIGLVLAFLCGIFVAIVDVVRVAYLQMALKSQLVSGNGDHVSASDRSPNYYWLTSWGFMWSAIECSVRVCCCCALVLKPFLQKLWPSSFLTATGSRLSRNRFSTSGGGASGGGSGAKGGQGAAGTAAAPANGLANGTANPQGNADPERSVLSFKGPASPRQIPSNLPIQAILERDPTTRDEDCMDLMEFFSGGPPDPRASISRSTAFGDGPPSPRLGIGHFGLGLADVKSNGDGSARHANGTANTNANDESPGLSDTVGTPLVTMPTRTSTRRWSILTLPKRWRTQETPPLEQTQQPTQQFFDVVPMGGRKPLTELTEREAWWPIMIVSILFALWGFSYGLLGNLNSQIMITVGNATPARTIALQNSYWLGYIIGPCTVGAYTLTQHGFKTTFITGLIIYGCAAMCFWPSSVLGSYGGFVFCNIAIAMGLSVLEVAANPYIALAGPGELSEARLNFSQGIQAVAGIFSPIIAEKVFFRKVGNGGRVSLFDVQWCYLAVALFVLFLALAFFYVPISEASDDELEADTVGRLENAGLNLASRAWHRSISARLFIIVAGTVVMMLYVGAQESLSYFWDPFITAIEAPGSRGDFWDITIGHGLFAFSRFLAAGACYLGATPRLVLNLCLLGTFLTTLLSVVLPKGDGPYVCALLALFFEGPVFPTLFATAIRGQGRWTKAGSIALTVSIGLAVVWQSSTWAIFQRTGDVRTSWILIVVMCGIQALYPLALDASSVLRRMVDPKWSVGARRSNIGRASISASSTRSRRNSRPWWQVPELAAQYGARSPGSALGTAGARGADGDPDGDTKGGADSDEKRASFEGDSKDREVGGRRGSLGATVVVKSRSNSDESGSPGAPAPRALPALPEEDDPALHGPTDDFAGIGVVGDLPEIK